MTEEDLEGATLSECGYMSHDHADETRQAPFETHPPFHPHRCEAIRAAGRLASRDLLHGPFGDLLREEIARRERGEPPKEPFRCDALRTAGRLASREIVNGPLGALARERAGFA